MDTLYRLVFRLESDILCTMKTIQLHGIIPESLNQQRLDVALSRLFPEYSRGTIQQWIKNSSVMINQMIIEKQRYAVQTGQSVSVQVDLIENTSWTIAQSIPLSLVYEDEFLIIVNKPAGLVVHPGAGNPDKTLVNALLHFAPELAQLPRAGIIHRLDKDTSGLLIIARTLPAHHALIQQMQNRHIHREYRALVYGDIISGGTIDEPIGRHPTQRIKMAVNKQGKTAITHYRVIERFHTHTLLSVQLETGRTHQIRVHFAHHHFSIVGDPVYGRHKNTASLSDAINTALRTFPRQALHAYRLKLQHPVTQKLCEWTAPIPDDMKQLIDRLRADVLNEL